MSDNNARRQQHFTVPGEYKGIEAEAEVTPPTSTDTLSFRYTKLVTLSWRKSAGSCVSSAGRHTKPHTKRNNPSARAPKVKRAPLLGLHGNPSRCGFRQPLPCPAASNPPPHLRHKRRGLPTHSYKWSGSPRSSYPTVRLMPRTIDQIEKHR